MRVTMQETHYKEGKDGYHKRGIVQTFSHRARARMVRRVAEIDWAKTGSLLFVTLTYPDAHADHTMGQRKIHRYRFNRDVENHLGRQVASVWRVEWKARLTGTYVGQAMPHIHNLYFGCRFMSKRWIAERWATAMGSREPIVVDVQRCDNYGKVSNYIAKYCAKEPDTLLLDNVPKRNKTGRHAGWLRKPLIPMCPEKVIEVRAEELREFLRGRANDLLGWYDLRFDNGFTIIGNEAKKLSEDIEQFVLDRGW